MIPAEMMIAGSAVACMEIASPWMMLVASPVVDALAIPRTGPNSVDV